jgi:hypothetical protein
VSHCIHAHFVDDKLWAKILSATMSLIASLSFSDKIGYNFKK